MNNVVLIGRITAKPELNYTKDGMAVTKFTLAVDRGKDKGADFIRVTTFGKRAETICRYMDKGRQIAVQGRINTGSYKDKDGKMVYYTEVLIDNDEFLGGSVKAEQVASEVADLFDTDVTTFTATDDDIPF